PASIEAGPIRLETEARRVIVAGEIVDLTATEFNLLERLIRAGNRVVAKDELSREVLGRPHETYDRSIDVHMSHLRRKLVERGVDETVLETVRGVGYRVNRA
ncbi:MAG TPA: DNA-binding response regulator, partial [Tistrella mobilis]|nr:DNA-binding response regulator [Tistrella mobilis]